MEDVTALEFAAGDHLVLADSTIFKSMYSLDFFLTSHHALNLSLSILILGYEVPDQREIFLQIFHKLFELNELFEIFEQTGAILNNFFTHTNMTNERNVEASYEHHKNKVQNMANIADDAHPEFVLNEINFVLVEVMVITLRIFVRILLFLLLSSIDFILDFGSLYFLLVKKLHVFVQNIFVNNESEAGVV